MNNKLKIEEVIQQKDDTILIQQSRIHELMKELEDIKGQIANHETIAHIKQILDNNLTMDAWDKFTTVLQEALCKTIWTKYIDMNT